MIPRTDRIDPPYYELLRGILRFGSFSEAEKTLTRLENLCQKYREASDKKGVGYCRKVALQGRRRAEIISRNQRVSTSKRLQKKEIATWFAVWMESPAIFADWLFLRKNTVEFQKLLELEQKERR